LFTTSKDIFDLSCDGSNTLSAAVPDQLAHLGRRGGTVPSQYHVFFLRLPPNISCKYLQCHLHFKRRDTEWTHSPIKHSKSGREAVLNGPLTVTGAENGEIPRVFEGQLPNSHCGHDEAEAYYRDAVPCGGISSESAVPKRKSAADDGSDNPISADSILWLAQRTIAKVAEKVNSPICLSCESRPSGFK
jgi:hypothetical protein